MLPLQLSGRLRQQRQHPVQREGRHAVVAPQCQRGAGRGALVWAAQQQWGHIHWHFQGLCRGHQQRVEGFRRQQHQHVPHQHGQQLRRVGLRSLCRHTLHRHSPALHSRPDVGDSLRGLHLRCQYHQPHYSHLLPNWQRQQAHGLEGDRLLVCYSLHLPHTTERNALRVSLPTCHQPLPSCQQREPPLQHHDRHLLLTQDKWAGFYQRHRQLPVSRRPAVVPPQLRGGRHCGIGFQPACYRRSGVAGGQARGR